MTALLFGQLYGRNSSRLLFIMKITDAAISCMTCLLVLTGYLCASRLQLYINKSSVMCFTINFVMLLRQSLLIMLNWLKKVKLFIGIGRNQINARCMQAGCIQVQLLFIFGIHQKSLKVSSSLNCHQSHQYGVLLHERIKFLTCGI